MYCLSKVLPSLLDSTFVQLPANIAHCSVPIDWLTCMAFLRTKANQVISGDVPHGGLRVPSSHPLPSYTYSYILVVTSALIGADYSVFFFFHPSSYLLPFLSFFSIFL